MSEKTEWEVIDGPQPGTRSGAHAHLPPQPTLQQLMKALLGRWWMWKILGTVSLAGLALVLIATLTGVFVLVLAVGAVLAIGVGKLKQWTRRRHGMSSS